MEAKQGQSGIQGGRKRERSTFGGSDEETREPPPQPRPTVLLHRQAQETSLPVLSSINDRSNTASILAESLLRQLTHNGRNKCFTKYS